MNRYALSRLLACCAIAGVAFLSEANAQTVVNEPTISAEQHITADWEYLLPGDFNARSGSFSSHTFSTGTTDEDLGIHGADTSNATLTVEFDESTGQVRSMTEIDINAPQAGENSLLKTVVTTQNFLSYTDVVTVNDPNAAYIDFYTVITGGITQDAEIIKQEYAFIYNLEVESDIGFFLDGTTSNSTNVTNTRGPEDDPSAINDTQPVEMTFWYGRKLTPGEPHVFHFVYDDYASFTIDGIDAKGFEVGITHDFMHTLTTYANVYDAGGNLLPDAQVESGFGFTYDAPPVPEPSSLALIGLAAATLFGRRRKS